jgi:hypothetical protein
MSPHRLLPSRQDRCDQVSLDKSSTNATADRFPLSRPEHLDACCAQGQASTACPHSDNIRRYAGFGEGSVGATSNAERKGHSTVFIGRCTGQGGRSQTGTDLCIGTTWPGTDIQDSSQTEGTQIDVDLASKLIGSGVTTQPIETVIAVLAASRNGASINAAAKASGINYMTAQRILLAAVWRSVDRCSTHCEAVDLPLRYARCRRFGPLHQRRVEDPATHTFHMVRSSRSRSQVYRWLAYQLCVR